MKRSSNVDDASTTILLYTQKIQETVYRCVTSFGMIRIRISDLRSLVHQMNQ